MNSIALGDIDGYEFSGSRSVLHKIDAIVEDNAVFWYTAKKARLDDQFKVAGTLTPVQKLTVGFSLKNPRARELSKVISDGLRPPNLASVTLLGRAVIWGCIRNRPVHLQQRNLYSVTCLSAFTHPEMHG